MQLYCPGCGGLYDQKHMRIVRDAYWCDACREAKRYDERPRKGPPRGAEK